MQYRRLAITIILGAIGPYAAAQDLLECVDPDVRAGLIGLAFDDTRLFTAEWPRFLDDLELPRGLSYIGATESEILDTAAFKSGLEPDAAMEQVSNVLSLNGWRPVAGPQRTQTGFVVGPRPDVATMFCRDAQRVNARAAHRNGATYISLNAIRLGAGSCVQDAFDTASSQQRVFDLSEFMPRFDMPRDSSQRRDGGIYSGVLSSSGSGGRNARTTTVQLVTSRDADSLATFFADQLRAQDWQLDAGWSGQAAAGSAWTASRVEQATGERIALVGLLDVAARGADRYDAQFRLLRVEE